MLARNLGCCCIAYLYARKRDMVKKPFFVLILVVVAAACLDEPDCYQLNNQFVGLAFRKLADSTADTIELTAFGTIDPDILFFEE